MQAFFVNLRFCKPQVQRRSGSQELHAADTIETGYIHIESYRYISNYRTLYIYDVYIYTYGNIWYLYNMIRFVKLPMKFFCDPVLQAWTPSRWPFGQNHDDAVPGEGACVTPSDFSFFFNPFLTTFSTCLKADNSESVYFQTRFGVECIVTGQQRDRSPATAGLLGQTQQCGAQRMLLHQGAYQKDCF